MGDYDRLTDAEFDEILESIVSQTPAGVLLTIPGAYEVLSEHFNNEVLEIWEMRQ